MELEIIAWLAAFILFIIIEILTFQLVTVWFAVGALAAMTAAMFNTSLEAQLTVFLIVSCLLLFALRPFVSKYIKHGFTKTNADSLIGMNARVTAQINNQEGFGTAAIRGMEWTAASEDDSEVIPAGTIVTVIRISGVKLIVRPAEASVSDEHAEQPGLKND